MLLAFVLAPAVHSQSHAAEGFTQRHLADVGGGVGRDARTRGGHHTRLGDGEAEARPQEPAVREAPVGSQSPKAVSTRHGSLGMPLRHSTPGGQGGRPRIVKRVVP